MRAVYVKYTLVDGTRGRLSMLVRSTCDAVIWVLETFGEDNVRSAGARVA